MELWFRIVTVAALGFVALVLLAGALVATGHLNLYVKIVPVRCCLTWTNSD